MARGDLWGTLSTKRRAGRRDLKGLRLRWRSLHCRGVGAPILTLAIDLKIRRNLVTFSEFLSRLAVAAGEL